MLCDQTMVRDGVGLPHQKQHAEKQDIEAVSVLIVRTWRITSSYLKDMFP